MDKVYWERNRLVAVLARVFPSGFYYCPEDSPEWSIVYIDLPTGQISFHVHESETIQFMGIPLADSTTWDGHDNEEKWRRCLKFILRNKELRNTAVLGRGLKK